jgi:hypothetical protein
MLWIGKNGKETGKTNHVRHCGQRIDDENVDSEVCVCVCAPHH